MATPPTHSQAGTAPPTDAAWIASPSEAASADAGCIREPAIAVPNKSDLTD